MCCWPSATSTAPALYLRLSHNPDLQPVGAQIATLTTAATRKCNEDTAYLDSLIHNLSGPPEDRDTALETLNNIGPSVVPRMLQHVAAPKGTESVEVIVQSIVRMGRHVVPVLLGALESTNEAVRTAGIQTLGYLGGDRPSLICSPPLSTNISRPAFAMPLARPCREFSACPPSGEKDLRRSERPPSCEKSPARPWRTVSPGRQPTD